MEARTSHATHGAPTEDIRASAEILLALIAAAFLAFAAIAVTQRGTDGSSIRIFLVLLAGSAAALAVGAAAAAHHSEKRTGWLLGGAALLGLPPSLVWPHWPDIAAVAALLAALVLVLVPILQREKEAGVDHGHGHMAVGVVSVSLLQPIGLFYIALGLLLPPYAFPILMLAYVVLFVGTLWLALRWSWWAATGPVAAVSVWLVVLWVTEYLFPWTP